MKVFNLFAQLFAIFTFLTIGSLLFIVAFHILSLDDALFKIREIYASPWESMKAGFLGLIFIAVGLAFTRMLLKKGRESEAVIFQGEIGPVVVSVNAIEDAVKKVLKKYHLVKSWRIKTLIRSKDVGIQIRVVLWSGGDVPTVLTELQNDVAAKVRKLLGSENKVEVSCDAHKIEEQEPEFSSTDADLSSKV